jgi:hypothetical protein
MMTPVITCQVCGGLIERHFELFAHAACRPPTPPAEPTRWEARKRANHDNIFVYSRQGGPMAVLEAYADALNKANELRGRALALVNGLGTQI